MRNKPLRPSPLFFTCLLFFFGLTSMERCADQSYYPTKDLRETQIEIEKSMRYLNEVRDTIKQTKCPEILRLDTFILAKNALFDRIHSWNLDSLNIPKRFHTKFNEFRVLTVDPNGMIRQDSIPLPTRGYGKVLTDSLDNLYHDLRVFNKSLKVYRHRIKRCVKRYNRCKELLVSGSNQERVKILKHALRYYMMNDEDFERNSSIIKTFADKHDGYLGKEKDRSEMFAQFHLATVYYLQFRLTGDSVYCNKSHIRWSSLDRIYREEKNDCEIFFIEKESREGWPVHVTPIWVDTQKRMTGECATHKRGCNCITAKNYDPTAEVNDGTCVACKDPLATNYCGNAEFDAPCIYLVCADSCYREAYVTRLYPRYRADIDSLRTDASLCQTDICGCMQKDCNTFDVTAEIDDGSCDCGCLDSLASNYALRPGKYYNPNVKTHQQELCHNRGCMSECADNYDPYAREPDGSCECKEETAVSLMQKIHVMEGKLIIDEPTVQDLERTFIQRFDNDRHETKRAARRFKFSRNGNSLSVEGVSRVDKIKSKGYADDIPTGVYNFPAMNEVVFKLMNFLDEATGGRMVHDRISGKVLGEADGQRIRSGIPFENAGVDIANAPFRIVPENINTDIDRFADETFDLTPNRRIRSLPDGGSIENNTELAFVRGYRIKNIMITILGDSFRDRIQVGAKANSRIGGRFRKISVVVTIEDFFLNDGKTKEELAFELEKLKAAQAKYEAEGYPSPGPNTYLECPCYSM